MSAALPTPEHFMQLAVAEAEKGLGRTHPNPAVGAVVVQAGEVVGRGFHKKAGLPHAEVEAMAEAGERARGADLYVTLEPCNHFGRTPPCTEAVIARGVRRVFVGSIDPNPLVEGRGLERLRAAGIEVQAGVLRERCDQVVRGFARHVVTGLPLVVLKAAATLDGKIATSTGDSKWVSGEDARRLVHLWRDEFDAVLVGAGTLRADDPQLTTRLSAPAVEGRAPRTPWRIVLGGNESVPAAAKLFDTAPGPVLFVTAHPVDAAFAPLVARGVEVVSIPGEQGRIEPKALVRELGRRGITSLLVEGGARVHASFLQAGVADELRLFLAPRIAGDDGLGWTAPLGVTQMALAHQVADLTVERVGHDLLLTGRPVRPVG